MQTDFLEPTKPRNQKTALSIVKWVILIAALAGLVRFLTSVKSQQVALRSAAGDGRRYATSDLQLRQALSRNDGDGVRQRIGSVPKSQIRPNVIDVLAFSTTADSLDAMLGAGWDPSGGRHNNAPMVAAVTRGDLKVMKVFLAHGLSPDSRGPNGWPLLIEAVSSLPIVTSPGGSTTPTHPVDDPVAARLLLDHGAKVDIEATNPPGSSLPTEMRSLTQAVLTSHVPSVQLLLQHHADVNWKPKNGAPAIVFASGRPLTLQLTRALLDHGAKPDNPGTLSRWLSLSRRETITATSLYFNAEDGDEEVVKLLIERGANPHIKASNGKTPIEAARGKALDYLRTLDTRR